MNVISPIYFSIRRACACFPLTVKMARHRRIWVIFEPEVVDKLVTWDVRFWPSPTKTNHGAVSEPSGERAEHCCRVNSQKRTRCLPKQHRRNDKTGGRQRRLSRGRHTAVNRGGEKCRYSRKTVCSSFFTTVRLAVVDGSRSICSFGSPIRDR